MRKSHQYIQIPTRWVGPMHIDSIPFSGPTLAPIATFETPLWPCINRGARVSRACKGGIRAIISHDCMTRSIVVQSSSAVSLSHVVNQLKSQSHVIQQIVEQTSQHLDYIDCQPLQIGNLLYLRLVINSHNAAGHNMVTKAADALITWLTQTFPTLQYVSISGNICTDKKTSAINSLQGRGKKIIAEILIPQSVCHNLLGNSPEQISNIHYKKNCLGSIVAGSICSANAHVANTLLGIYLATGQDAANIVEGSQAIVHAETMDDALYFSVTLPNLILGTTGNGKHHPDTQHNLMRLGCTPDIDHSSQKLGVIVAASVLCSELSLLAAQTHPGELMRAHTKLERAQ